MIHVPTRNSTVCAKKENSNFDGFGKPAYSIEIKAFGENYESAEKIEVLNNSRYLNEEINLGSCDPSYRSKNDCSV